ncbi:WbqC family protein, partial [Oleiphilus sp. HI0067]
MKVAIMQPYFLPYQGYWQLFSEADVFVLFDVVKFQKRSWMSRNRVLHSDPSKEFNYIKMPCIADSQTMISDVSVSLGADWLGHIEGVLSVYKRMKAPNYERVYALFEKWANSNRSGFTDVIQLIVEDLLPVIGVGCDVLQASSLGLDFSDIRGPGDWALQITKALGGDEYVNPCGGV